MASGDFSYCDPRELFICVPWEGPSCYTLAYNGYEFYNENGQGGFYCASGSYCPSGYKFFNQKDFGSGIFINSTGCYDCNAYSDGVGSYYFNTVYYSGTILNCSGIEIDIDGQLFKNGYLASIADGNGNYFNCCCYCNFGFSFFNTEYTNFLSDGSGNYFLTDLFCRKALDVCIFWDFSKTTKSKYNFCKIDACGADILLSIKNLTSCFFEINSLCETSICLLEAQQNQSLFIEEVCSPFIYFKNFGPNDINIILSDSNEFICFKEKQNLNKINFSGKNVKLKEKESIIFSLNISADGSRYYSNINYPFGFFYEFTNTREINELGLYPVCCIYDCLSSKYFPNYLYSDVCCLQIQSGSVLETGEGFNYTKQLSQGEKLKVDYFSNLQLSFFKETGTGACDIFCIKNNFDIFSNYGLNQFKSEISTNFIQIVDETGIFEVNSQNSIFSKIIENNSCINIIYDIDLVSNKFYNLIYLDCNSGNPNYDLTIKKINNLNECSFYSRDDLYNSGNILNLKDNERAYVKIDLSCNSLIKGMANKNIDRDNLYLPIISDFCYDYCFELNKSNFIKNKILTGFWNFGNVEFENSGFCNYSLIINCCDPNYLLYKSDVYKIKLCNQQNRAKTISIQNKTNSEISDDFYIQDSNLECCFYFCGLEFRYIPAQCIIYRNNSYQISSNSVQTFFNLSGNCEVINFPIDAINYKKLKINTDYEIFDLINCSNIDINYSDFSFKKEYSGISRICYQVPIIQLENLSGYEYPQILINNEIVRKKQTNIKFDINPMRDFISDSFYGLNNFLLFLTSKMNSGIALDFLNCETNLMCDYYYGSSDYNFLMMDLKSEYDSACFSLPITCWCNILQLASFDDAEELISYKNITGAGYNYIMPVTTLINYSDKFFIDCCSLSSTIVKSGLLNYVSTGFNYDGSSRSVLYLFDQNQVLTGCSCRIDSGSYFSISNNNYFINIQSSDLTGAIKCREINISKNYQFTGIQPFFINSNYIMLDIKEPILCNNLQKYSYFINEEVSSGIYYYTYNINNPQNTILKLMSPELTCISSICFGNNKITTTSNDSKIGLIQNNSAKINLDICSLIYENPYVLNCDSIQKICINIVGGL